MKEVKELGYIRQLASLSHIIGGMEESQMEEQMKIAFGQIYMDTG
jgi:hypothetical protein